MTLTPSYLQKICIALTVPPSSFTRKGQRKEERKQQYTATNHPRF